MHEIDVRVRFCETDALGHVNNTSYFIYFEEARIRFIESLGHDMEVEQWNFILASTKCDFINQGYFNQELTIRTSVSKVGSKSLILDHDIICSKTKQVVARGSDVMVFFDFDKQESDNIPDFLREALTKAVVRAQKSEFSI